MTEYSLASYIKRQRRMMILRGVLRLAGAAIIAYLLIMVTS